MDCYGRTTDKSQIIMIVFLERPYIEDIFQLAIIHTYRELLNSCIFVVYCLS
jgi:hypothetical protein